MIREAITDGLAFERKGNEEVVCGIRPDQMVTYVSYATGLHRYGKLSKDYALLCRAAKGIVIRPEDAAGLSRPRTRTVQEVSRFARAGSFRRLVLQAYDRRCAVTGMQLKLVDAAHILPVGAPGSTDEVINGVAICPTYHRAFDRGLIYIDERYIVRLNQKKADHLRSVGLGAGLGDFIAPLERKIVLPTDGGAWPSRRYIRKANQFRRIS
jgi:putative restriction endonuclease